MRIHPLPVLALLALSGIGLSASEWPMFRGPGALGIGAGSPPVTWDLASGRNLMWRTPIPGLGHSSPIAWGDRAYLTTAVPLDGTTEGVKLGTTGGVDSAADAGEFEWRLYAIDLSSGKVAWQRVAHKGRPRVERHVKASHASATPATNGRVIVALMGSEGLFAFDMTGWPLWRADLGVMDVGLVDDPTYQWGLASSPVIAGDRILVQNDQHKGSFFVRWTSRPAGSRGARRGKRCPHGPRPWSAAPAAATSS